jgi:hypothetical protein
MINDNYPDAWLILEIRSLGEKKSVRKIFSTYNDEFGVPARWTLNSGIVEASKSKNIWKFTGNSGGTYGGPSEKASCLLVWVCSQTY